MLQSTILLKEHLKIYICTHEFILYFVPPALTVADAAGNISHCADVRPGRGRSPHLHFSDQAVSLRARQDPLLRPGVSAKIQLLGA